jgi:hypothetical protein
MTIEHLTLVCVGVLVNVLTFALGFLSGASLPRKDSRHDRDRYEAESRKWHQVSKN